MEGRTHRAGQHDRDHIRGPIEAPITLLEYGDYQCPFCGLAYPVVEELRATLGDEMCFAFRHFPLTTVHPYAWGAAEAAEAAGGQQHFWPMHDLLFRDQGHLAPADLVSRALILKLDTDQFQRDLRNGVYTSRVQADFLSGVRSGVPGTPTFFINGVRYQGAVDYPSLLAAAEVSASSAVR